MCNILQIVSSIDEKSGGVASGIINSVNASFFPISHHDVLSGDEFTYNFSRENSEHFAVGPMRTGWAFMNQLEGKLGEIVRNYDLIIINGLWQYPSYCAMKVIQNLRKKGIKTPKVYVMPHGMLDPWFQRAPSRRWKALRNEIYWALIERQVVNSADGLLFTCQQELELARTTFWGYKPKQEINVGYGILPPPAYTEEIGNAFQHPRPYFLFLSRIHEKKGVDLLITAYQQLREENPKGVIPDLVIAGPGLDTAYGQKVQAMVQSQHASSIHFVGMLSGDAKWGALYGCEAFVLPSHQENFGIAVVEALACGKPVLISDQVNIWKEVNENGAGIIIKMNIDSIVQGQKELILMVESERSKIREMSQMAKKCFETHFTVHSFSSHLEKLWVK